MWIIRRQQIVHTPHISGHRTRPELGKNAFHPHQLSWLGGMSLGIVPQCGVASHVGASGV